jgi:hypothetical protein
MSRGPPCENLCDPATQQTLCAVGGQPRPFEEVNPCDGLGFEPDTLLHLLRGETLTPTSCLFLRQVRERARRCGQIFDLCKDLPASGRDEAGTYPRCVMKSSLP